MKKLIAYSLLLIIPAVSANESFALKKLRKEHIKYKELYEKDKQSSDLCKIWMLSQSIASIEARNWSKRYAELYSEREVALQGVELLPDHWQGDCQQAQLELRGFVNQAYDDAEILSLFNETPFFAKIKADCSPDEDNNS